VCVATANITSFSFTSKWDRPYWLVPLEREREKKKKKSLVIARPFSFLVIEKKQAAFSIFKRLDIYQGNMNNTPSEARFYEIISPFSSYCFSLGSS
jgi:hypothetical protein